MGKVRDREYGEMYAAYLKVEDKYWESRRVTHCVIPHSHIRRISIHTLTRRVTWHVTYPPYTALDFNPHPHTEGDQAELMQAQQMALISIHTLTRRVTSSARSCYPPISYFNPHPHTEGDSFPVRVERAPLHFNPHPHTEGDTDREHSVNRSRQFQSTPSHGG